MGEPVDDVAEALQLLRPAAPVDDEVLFSEPRVCQLHSDAVRLRSALDGA